MVVDRDAAKVVLLELELEVRLSSEDLEDTDSLSDNLRA